MAYSRCTGLCPGSTDCYRNYYYNCYYKCLAILKNPREGMTLNACIRRIKQQSVFLPLFSLRHWQGDLLPLKGVTDYSSLSGSQVFEIFIIIIFN